MQIRGGIIDRPWGRTLATLARRGVTGWLTVRSGDSQLSFMFEQGHVVGSYLPGTSQASPDHLRRDTIANVSRTFALDRGEFVFDAQPVAPTHAPIHVGGLIFNGARAFLSEPRLHAALRELGSRFQLPTHQLEDLACYGFGDPEMAIVHALARGLSLAEIDALPDPQRRIARITIYTLAALGDVVCEHATPAPRLARGTQTPAPPTRTLTPRDTDRMAPRTLTPRQLARQEFLAPGRSMPRASQPPPISETANPAERAAAAYRRGQGALREERLPDAVHELELAVELKPDDFDYKATLAWARFCSATDKPMAAPAVRTALKQAILASPHPVVPYYYLGLVERILGRSDLALEHFQQVLDLDPHHAAAGTELRFLTRQTRR